MVVIVNESSSQVWSSSSWCSSSMLSLMSRWWWACWWVPSSWCSSIGIGDGGMVWWLMLCSQHQSLIMRSNNQSSIICIVDRSIVHRSSLAVHLMNESMSHRSMVDRHLDEFNEWDDRHHQWPSINQMINGHRDDDGDDVRWWSVLMLYYDMFDGDRSVRWSSVSCPSVVMSSGRGRWWSWCRCPDDGRGVRCSVDGGCSMLCIVIGGGVMRWWWWSDDDVDVVVLMVDVQWWSSMFDNDD